MISLPIVTIFLLPFLTSTLAQIETASAGFYLLIDQPNSKHDNLSFLSISVSDGNRAITPNFISPSIDKSITPVFHLNTTGSDTNSGFLNLENHDNESNYIASVPLAFSLDPTSNVATALFSTAFLSSYLFIPEVYFDESGHLGIRTNYDDTVNPPDYSNYTTYYKWYLCSSAVSNGANGAEMLSWVVGRYDTPQNPSCVSVGVRRVWVGDA